MKHLHGSALILATLLGAGCAPEPADPPPGETAPLGDLKLALAPPPEGVFDVAQVRFEVSAPGADPQTRTVQLGGQPPEAAWLLALRPGPWHVTATPLTAGGQPSGFCLAAEGDAQVRPQATASLRLRMPCDAEGVGALDVGAAFGGPPHIEELDVLRGGTRLCVGEVLHLASRVSVPDGPDPAMAWRVEDADPAAFCARAAGHQIAFSAAAAGGYLLRFTAANDDGEASLEVPVEVRDCDGPLLCPGAQIAPVFPEGAPQGTCACEAGEGEPAEGVALPELVVAPDHPRDQRHALALAPVAAPGCAPGAELGAAFVLHVARAGLVDLRSAGGGDTDTALAVFAADGAEVGCATDGGDGGDAWLPLALDAGTYTVRVVAEGAPGPFQLLAAQADPIQRLELDHVLEADTAQGLRRAAPCAATAGLARPFAFALAEPDRFSLAARLPAGGDVVLWIENEAGEAVACVDDVDGPEPVLDLELLPGRYTALVAAKDDVPVPFRLEAGAGLPALPLRLSGVDGLLPEARAEGELTVFTHGTVAVHFAVELEFLAEIVAIPPDGDERRLPVDGDLSFDLDALASEGTWIFRAVDDAGRPLSTQTIVTLSNTYLEPADGLFGSTGPYNVVACGPLARYDRVAADCVPCGGGGFRDPDDGELCRSCPPPQVVRWQSPGGPLRHHPSPGSAALCVCPPHQLGQPGACQERCPDGEYWDASEGACSSYPVGDPAADDDGDGLDGATEAALGTDPRARDTDADGVDDGVENAKGFNPLQPDSDGDGLGDGLEYWTAQTNPLVPDTDGDGLSDSDEYHGVYPTDPNRADTDGDALTDGDEVNLHGTRPNLRDSDGDTLDDCAEIQADCGAGPVVGWRASDPLEVDTDGDGLLDPFERARGTDPASPDTDGDGIDDPTELRLNLNATSACACDRDLDGRMDDDADGDGLTDRDEYVVGVVVPGIGRTWPLPWVLDTDGDGIDDGLEVNGYQDAQGNTHHTDPTRADTDGDGLEDLREIGLGTDPVVADTDGDGLSDGDEVRRYGTDPTRADQDGDGLIEWRELQLGTDMKSADTDGDGVDDGADPQPLNPADDPDGDGLGSARETAAGLDPLAADSDGDGLGDFAELITYGTWPMNQCASNNVRDCDGDGLEDAFEVFTVGSHPRLSDTDGDGDGDWAEWLWTGSRARVNSRTVKYAAGQPAHRGAGGYRFFGGTAFPPDDQPLGLPAVADPRGLRSIVIAAVKQQLLGDCWLLAAVMSTVGTHPAYVRDLITPHGDGTYTVKLYRNSNAEPVFLRVDAQFPTDAGGNPVYAGVRTTTVQRNVNGRLVSVNVPVLFPALLEKAAAQLEGRSYLNLDGGVVLLATAWRGLEMLTGARIDWSWGALDRHPIYRAYFYRAAIEDAPLTFSTFLPRADCRHQNGTPLVDRHVYAHTGVRDAAADTWEIWNPWNAFGSYLGASGQYAKVGDLTPLRTAECFIGGSISSRRLGAPFIDRAPRP